MFTPKDSQELETLLTMYTDINFSDGIAPFIGALQFTGVDTTEHFSAISGIYQILDEQNIVTRVARLPNVFMPSVEDNEVFLLTSVMRTVICTMEMFRIFVQFLDKEQGIILYKIHNTKGDEFTSDSIRLQFNISPVQYYAKEQLLKIQNKTQ